MLNPKLTDADFAHYHVDGPAPDAPSRTWFTDATAAQATADYMTRGLRDVGIVTGEYTVRPCGDRGCFLPAAPGPVIVEIPADPR